MSHSDKFIPYGRQSLDDADIDAVVDVLKSDWLTQGDKIEKFEKSIAEQCGAKYVVVCSSGTAALHLAYLALGISADDVIVTSPITFLATANAARYLGANVVFSDVEAETANLSLESLKTVYENQKKNKPKLVVPVHFAGHPVDIKDINEFAKKNGMFVVEDAAHALGAEYFCDNQTYKVGSCKHSDMTTFSFHPVKHITTGEGGAITTNDSNLYKRLLKIRNHGISKEEFVFPEQAYSNNELNPWYYEMQLLGYNYRITDIQCALGLSQIKKLSTFVERRREIANMYRDELSKKLSSIAVPLQEKKNNKSSYHLFPVKIDYKQFGKTRAEVMNALRDKGVGTQVHYIPLYHQPYYSEITTQDKNSFSNTEEYYEKCLSLPMFPAMSDEDVFHVVKSLESILLAGETG